MRRPWEWLGVLVLLAAPVLAQEVPPALRDWKEWVLHDVPTHACPILATGAGVSDERPCAWPGRLTLEAGKDGARFGFEVHVDARSWVPLPGNARYWPQQVSADGKPVAVLEHDNAPALQLEPGDHALRGMLPWTSRPVRLRVPESIGLVALTLDGNAVSHIERNGDQLTLGEAAAAQRAADALSVRVFRRLSDGMPPRLETQLQINVTGSARELVLGPALPGGFVATSLDGDLPARLENDGRLRIQLRPGQWELNLGARGTDVLSRIALHLPAEPWPRQEIWSYADDPDLRSTRVQGQATDAAQADVPGGWGELPAYVLDDADGLTIEQGTRGGEGGKGDQLSLTRQLWLDFDGDGFTAADHLAGTLRRSLRLDVAAPWQLLNASQGGKPLLVTSQGKAPSGVELRETAVDLSAGLRFPGRGVMPSGGWQAPLEAINATLHLPPGYRLIGASGADRSPNSWIAQWSLLDLFVVALIALLAGRLVGWPWALVALGFLALSQHEGDAPRWTLAAALALALLMRALPEGRLRAFARIGAGALLVLAVLWALPFASTQMDYALHPQLEQRSVARFAPAAGFDQERVAHPQPAVMEEASTNAEPAAPAPYASPQDIVAAKMAPPKIVQQVRPPAASRAAPLSSVTVTGSRITAANTIGQEMDAHSIVQAGRGMPQWDNGNDYVLGWSGPITSDQATRLVIAPAWLVRLLRVIMLAMLVALLGKLVLTVIRPMQAPWHGLRTGGAVALLALMLVPQAVQAQSTPGSELLGQYHERLIEAPPCAPNCVSAAQASLQASVDRLSLDLDVHAGAAIAVPIPQGDDALSLQSVAVDGRDAELLRVDDSLLVKLDRGVHRIALRYGITSADTATLRFPLRPQRVMFNGEGWKADGVDDDRLLGDSLALNRVRANGDGKAVDLVAQAFPPYVRLTRTLELGTQWMVRNTAVRVAPAEGGFSLDLPLLHGEHPLGDDARVHDGRIGITFTAGQDEVSWTSRLDRADQLELSAPSLGERAEQWVLQSAPMWHVEAKGVPGAVSDNGLSFQPLPGERLQVAISQPKAVPGDSLAFDLVNVASHAGDRVTESELTLMARSTRGGEHAIGLPVGAELLDARRDGAPLNLAIRDGKLSLPLLPGTHHYSLRLREPQGVSFSTRTPSLSLGAPSANITLLHALPEDRWVLWTWGPTSGPAVLYWSQLVLLLLAAWLLARHAPTPLRFHQWLLLGLGFSAFAWGAYAFVVAWLILLGLRARYVAPDHLRMRFNLCQGALAAVTLAALAVLVSAVPKGLLGLPDMHVVGNDSTAWRLDWFADQIDDALPRAGVLSVSIWVYKIAMLLWAIWLANALIGWLRWGFEAWSRGGYWRPRKPRSVEPPPVPQVSE